MNFDRSYDKVIGIHEGLYSNDPDDAGGETYKGISRKNNPKWEGWVIIDAAKKLSSFPANLKNNAGLEELVKVFYKRLYWDCYSGDGLPYELSSELFDIAVNCGQPKAIEYLQRSLNILNRKGRDYPDISVDSQFGVQTANTLNSYLRSKPVKLLVNVLNIFQGKHYIESMERNSTNEKYLGWFSRVEITK